MSKTTTKTKKATRNPKQAKPRKKATKPKRLTTAWADMTESERARLADVKANGKVIIGTPGPEGRAWRKKRKAIMATPSQIVVVFGSRTIPINDGVRDYVISHLNTLHVRCIISGGARGADVNGEHAARHDGHPLVLMPADWKRHGKSAGFKRNDAMARLADRGMALWDGKSRGTAHMIAALKAQGKPCLVINQLTRTTTWA